MPAIEIGTDPRGFDSVDYCAQCGHPITAGLPHAHYEGNVEDHRLAPGEDKPSPHATPFKVGDGNPYRQEANADNAVRIVEVDQWTSTGNVKAFHLADFEANPREALARVCGGDSEAARTLFGGHVAVRTVRPTEQPSLGHVWFREGAGGLEQWRANYDSSD